MPIAEIMQSYLLRIAMGLGTFNDSALFQCYAKICLQNRLELISKCVMTGCA